MPVLLLCWVPCRRTVLVSSSTPQTSTTGDNVRAEGPGPAPRVHAAHDPGPPRFRLRQQIAVADLAEDAEPWVVLEPCPYEIARVRVGETGATPCPAPRGAPRSRPSLAFYGRVSTEDQQDPGFLRLADHSGSPAHRATRRRDRGRVHHRAALEAGGDPTVSNQWSTTESLMPCSVNCSSMRIPA